MSANALTAADVATPWRLLRSSIRSAPGWTTMMILATVTDNAATLLLPAALGGVVDAVVAGSLTGPGLTWLIALFGAAMVSAVIGTWSNAASGAIASSALRQALVRSVLSAGVPGQRRFAAGDLTSRVVASGPQAAGLVSVVVSVVNSALLSAGGVVALLLIHWSLAVAVVLCVPAAMVLMRRFMAEASTLTLRYQQLQGRLSALLVEALGGARTIRASGTTEREVQRVLSPLPELSAVGRARWDMQRRNVWKISTLNPVVEIVVLGVAGIGVSAGRISAGEWIAAAGYVMIALRFLDVTDSVIGLADIRAGLTRLAEVLEMPAAPGGTRTIGDGPGAITFRSVTIGLAGQRVIDRLDLDIAPGLLVAIVGRSGAGKSTLAALAGGLLAPDEGQVLLDGVPLTELRPDHLRQTVAYAFERPFLLGETVHDAVAFGHDGSSRAQVELAAELVSADGFIRRLPEGYDTPLSRAPFSGGELQRIGLARAVTGEPRVLILDDATSSLDIATEAQVTKTLTHVLAGRTRIIVAHRASTAARADLVVWLDEGRVRAIGAHEQLWLEPAYATVFGVTHDLVEEAA